MRDSSNQPSEPMIHAFTLRRYLQLMDEYGCDVIVKRPDYYLFGACATVAGLPALIADLRDQLQSVAR